MRLSPLPLLSGRETFFLGRGVLVHSILVFLTVFHGFVQLFFADSLTLPSISVQVSVPSGGRSATVRRNSATARPGRAWAWRCRAGGARLLLLQAGDDVQQNFVKEVGQARHLGVDPLLLSVFLVCVELAGPAGLWRFV